MREEINSIPKLENMVLIYCSGDGEKECVSGTAIHKKDHAEKYTCPDCYKRRK